MSLSEDLKREIQEHYREFLKARGLHARLGQKQMIANIANHLGAIECDAEQHRSSEQHIAVVEAGTGTGKTIAYLLAVLPIAKAMNKKVVIATATVALQEQIVHKDLPELKANTSLKFRFSLAKGRGRYLCLTKLDRLLNGQDPGEYEDEPMFIDESTMALYQSMVQSLAGGQWCGDRDAWPEELSSEQWQPLATNHHQCTGRRCSHVTSCAFFKARESLESVDCIVANHDLVLADLALGGGAILPAPEDTIYIFDEGHHLPDKALGHFAHHSRLLSTMRFVDQGPGLLEKLVASFELATSVLSQQATLLPALMARAKAALDQIYHACKPLIDSIEDEKRYRFSGPVPSAIREPASQLVEIFTELAQHVEKMLVEVESILEERHCPIPRDECEHGYALLGQWQGRMEANRALWASYCTEEDDIPIARWLTLVDTGNYLDFEVCSSPILSATHLQESLWERCFGAVITSATLTALNRFDRFIMRSGVPETEHFSVVASPFDVSQAGLLIPHNSREGNQVDEHTDSVVEQLPALLEQQLGSLVLFASRKQMMQVYEALPSSWHDSILVQGDKSKQSMINEHKKAIDEGRRSVLFGLASFAEGVDLPGAYCEHVIIAKLPFSVPTDPIEATLAEWFESNGRNAFMEMTIPDASVKLVQACGRLLRTESDGGQITILDKRMHTKRYGKMLLQSLPAYRLLP